MTKKNKWWLIVVYCLLAVLVVSVVVSCFVKVSSKPEINGPDYYYVITDSQLSPLPFADKENNKEKYDEINNAFEKSFKEALLTSLFSGRLSFESKIEVYTSAPTFKGYKLKLGYGKAQKIMYKGKEYNPPTNSQETVEYKGILIDVQNGLGYTTNYIYYEYSYIDTNNVQQTGYYQQSIQANFDELYKVIAE